MSKVRVRYAPSPTGIPHVGNIRTALFDYLFARGQGGEFILRIEDTDQARLVPESVEKIKESLKLLNLNWDEEHQQSQRLDVYRKYLEELKEKNHAYEDEGAWRFRVEKGEEISWEDGVHKKVSFSSDVIEDFVIIKSDNYPTYHFASVVDDHEMQISHVLRGDEWISSTPKHLLLYKALGWESPTFVHLPAILGPDHKKLSKREGARSVIEYIEDGYLPEALINFLVLLGWAPKDNQELFTLAELEKIFTLNRINKNSPIFNIEKLNWFNKKYIQKLPAQELIKKLKEYHSHNRAPILSGHPELVADLEYDRKVSGSIKIKKILNQVQNDEKSSNRQIPTITEVPNEKLIKIVELTRDRMTTLKDFDKFASIFFQKGDQDAPEKEKAQAAKVAVEKIEKWDEENITKSLDEFVAENNLNAADFKNTLRLAVFADNTPPIYPSLSVLSKEEVLERIKAV